MGEIAIVGITGDPPTLGHEWLARSAHETGKFDEVWFMPCFKHKFGKEPVNSEMRVEMTRLMTEGMTHEFGFPFQVSNFEIHRQSLGSAYQTLKDIHDEYPNHCFSWVTGMDNALLIDKWANADRLILEYPMVVCRRGGIDIPEGDHWFLTPPHIFVSRAGEIKCASSDFRKAIRKGNLESARRMVRPEIYDFVIRESIYQETGE